MKANIFVVDIAMLLDSQSRFAEGVPMQRYLWMDSSPQIGRNWLWVQEHVLPQAKAVHLMYQVWELIAHMSAVEPDQLRDYDVVSPPHIRALCKSVMLNLRHHVHTPVALGSGMAKEVHEAAAVAHVCSLAAGGGMQGLKTYLSEVRATCTDMGTELGLSSLQVSADILLPPWLRRCRPMAADDAEELGGAILHGEELPVCCDDEEDMYCSLHADDEEELLDDDAAGGLNEGSGGGSGPADADIDLFLPRSIPVAGLQHVLDNLTSDTHRHLKHWPAYHASLKNLEAFLSYRFRRERFTRWCLRGTPHACREQDFANWSKTLYDKRWREVVAFVRSCCY